MLSARLGGSLFLLALAAALPAQSPSPANAAQSEQTSAAPTLANPTLANPTLANPVPANPTPADPLERLDAARRLNGLVAPDAAPWHLKALYQLYSESGKPTDSGTFEEWWFSGTHYKVAYHSPHFNQEEYANERGAFRTGDQGWPAWPLGMLRQTIESPVPPADEFADYGLHNLKRAFQPVELPCTALMQRGGSIVNDQSPSLCFDAKTPILRFFNSYGLAQETIYGHVAPFNGRYVGRDMHIRFLERPALDIHVEELQSIPSSDTVAAAPAEALPAVRRLELPMAFQYSHLLNRVPPSYPALKLNHEDRGTAFVLITIAPNGRVIGARPFAGDPLFVESLMEVIRTWEFKPASLGKEPLETETLVEQIFYNGQAMSSYFPASNAP